MTLPELSWPRRILGPPPSEREIKLACSAYLVCIALLLAAVLAAARPGTAALGFGLKEDFIAFYGVGRLLNEYPPDRLYDFQIQERVYRELRPGETHLTLPYVHAPFEALLFRPLALLPYRVAYLLWLAFGLVAYSVALVAVTNRFGPKHGPERTVLFLLAYSFSPFVMESWIGGNVAVLPFLALALALTLEDARRPVLGGFALALCLNKPSLLVLIVPMLLVSRRFKMLAGFAAGAAALIASSALLVGVQAWLDFVGALLWWAQRTAIAPGFFRDFKYVDLNAFTRILPGGRSWLGLLITTGFSLWVLFVLFRTWSSLPRAPRELRSLAWAGAITWSLVLNAYVPIYDCTLLVLAGILTAAALRDSAGGSVSPTFQVIVALCYVSAWVTQYSARFLRVQIYTLVLVYAGMWLLQQVRRLQAPRERPCPNV